MKHLKLASLQKSTVVPFYNLAVRAADSVLPSLTARWAEHIFMKPPKFPRPSAEAEFLAQAHRFTFKANGKSIAAWSWGDGPTVFFVHGWGGRGGQFYLFVKPLVQAGFSVVVFDVPGHGDTQSDESTFADFSKTITTAVESMGPAHAIVAHSIGAAATAYALRKGLKTDRVVFIAAPANSPYEWSHRLAKRLGISESTRRRMQDRIETRLNISWSDLSILETAKKMSSKLLVIHDQNDNRVPWQAGADIASHWPNAELETTHALGHSRILKNPQVIQRVVSFLQPKPKVMAG